MAGGLEHREVVGLDIDAAPDVVWDHLRDPALVRRWFGWDREGIDGEIREMFGVRPVASETSSVGGAPVRALAWPRGDRVQVTPVAGESHHRSHLSVQRTAHDGITTFDGVHDPRDEAWIAGAHQLKFALEQFPGEERRTVVMRDVDAGPLRDRLLDRLGLHGLRGVPVGGHVEAELPDGSMIGGQILYKSQHQVGLRLYAERPALLVLMETPAGSRPPHGLLTAVLSLYGVDDEAVARVLARWETWWSGAATSSTASPRRTRVS
ncbi:hypothetical protein [Cellulomonas chengniuliangii]|uniref:Activator of HSP90 ATPase n=1 Tax=Cellulomonas chengniuliangii TaxID=2968084 RepID=A0ABY5L3I8_9CELL|nr:hypothetical protein [Cellulomonas chengniuliangii]MCC2309288.1 hypothetical protein [Cellulomonas chengniuliangii]MCC2316550.1 hypothetical protein [Cellulomonas chengniuliangii]UUI75143.1 hypothetical protein NP064_15430 [Cellulomonas chengniuliangii]